ncbi:trypsin 5G1 [Aphomia sociella]
MAIVRVTSTASGISPNLSGFLNVVTSLPTIERNDDMFARIVNGYVVDITEIPYQASLRRRVSSGWTHTCGAVVISDRAVLTAGHCAVSYELNMSLLRVVVGTARRLSGGQSYDVSTILVHEEYSPVTLENDIAVVVTDVTITFSENVNSVTIAPLNFQLPENTKAVVSGFGTTSYEGTASSVLLAAKVNIISQQTCARAYLRIATITTGMVCATAQDPPRDACQGDSGGPLVADGYLVGLVSWGEGCADATYPGVYTRVSAYIDWIQVKLNLI